MTLHPNFNCVRQVIERLPDVWPDELICEEWRGNTAAAVLGITAVIGVKPSRRKLGDFCGRPAVVCRKRVL